MLLERFRKEVDHRSAFLNEDYSAMEAEEAISDSGSPTSHLDFKNQLWDSYTFQTTPIL